MRILHVLSLLLSGFIICSCGYGTVYASDISVDNQLGDVALETYKLDDGTLCTVYAGTPDDSGINVMSDDEIMVVSDSVETGSRVWSYSGQTPALWSNTTKEDRRIITSATDISGTVNIGTELSGSDLNLYKTNMTPFTGCMLQLLNQKLTFTSQVYETNIQLSKIIGTFTTYYNILWDPASCGNFNLLFDSAEVAIVTRDVNDEEHTFSFTRSILDDGSIDLSWQAPVSQQGTDIYLSYIQITFTLANYGVPMLTITTSPVNAIGARWRLAYADNISIYDSNSLDNGSQTIINQQSEANGLLSRILGTLQGLGASIADAIIDGLAGLFIPSQEDLEEINTRWQEMLESKLGFVWQAGAELTALGEAVVDEMEGGEAHAFVFPGISFPYDGEELVILSETQVSLDNDFMDVLQPVLASVVIAVCVIAFINTAEDMLTAIVSGASYFEYLHRGKDG